MDLALACLAALVAGFVDAVAGGGGLIQLPALLVLMPGVPVPVVLGTNKASSIFGTAAAFARYATRIAIPWRSVGAAAAAAFAGSWLGADAATLLRPEVMRPVVLVLLAAVAVFTFTRRGFGTGSGAGTDRPLVAVLLGGLIGFYDGFFGPGTGTFLIFLFVWALRMDFLGASASAKGVNVATNLAALISFSAAGAVRWDWAMPMAAANIVGSVVGARMAIAHGSALVRRVFQGVVVAILARLAWQTFAG